MVPRKNGHVGRNLREHPIRAEMYELIERIIEKRGGGRQGRQELVEVILNRLRSVECGSPLVALETLSSVTRDEIQYTYL